jgi:hypothetical protein
VKNTPKGEIMKANLATTQQRIIEVITEREAFDGVQTKRYICKMLGTRKDFAGTYRYMLNGGYIRETGTGKAGDPVIVHLGSKPRDHVAELIAASDQDTIKMFILDVTIKADAKTDEERAKHLKVALEDYRAKLQANYKPKY